MASPAGNTRPKKPSGQVKETSNGKKVIIDSEDSWEVGTPVYAFLGEDDEYGDYDNLNAGTYNLINPTLTMVVDSGSEISSIS